ncbi:MAG: hypothetical protein ACTSRG_13025 [Candidatus Helarchaeota archaeon]
MIEYNPLAYTSPETKTKVEFIYDGSLQDEMAHSLGQFSFAGVDGEHYQDRSRNTGSYTFLIKLKDEDSLRLARLLFNEKTSSSSTGILDHPDPTLGSFPVVVSSFKVSQNSVKGQGVINVEVSFFKTIPDLLAGDSFAQENPASAQSILAAIAALNESQANDLNNSVDLSTGAGFAAFIQSTISIVNSGKDSLENIANKLDEISIAFTDTYLDIINNVETYATTPFELARKIQNFLQLPMLATQSVEDRSAAYNTFLNGNETFSIETISEINSGSPSGKTILSNRSLASLAAISALNYTSVSGESVSIDRVKAGEFFEDTGYLSRQEIIDQINFIQSRALITTQLYSLLAKNFGANIFFSQYFDYSILNKALVSIAVKNLNNRIFSTIAEQSIELSKDTTPIVLCSELYQSVELSTIQFLLDSNNLRGDNIFLIPKGTEIKYY